MRHLKSNIEDQDIFQSEYKIKLSFSKVGTRMKEESASPLLKLAMGLALINFQLVQKGSCLNEPNE